MPSTRASAGHKPPAKIVFVTVGSTLFPALTNAIFSLPIQNLLVGLGVERLVVQIGRGDPPNLSGRIEGLQTDPNGNGGSFRYHAALERDNNPPRMLVEWMRYTDDFEQKVKEADAVISHAGSGSILTALRAQKPLLVVPNESLMDNHQGQLADALQNDGYLMVSSVEDLAVTLPSFLHESWLQKRVPFPDVHTSRFRSILDETAGFA